MQNSATNANFDSDRDADIIDIRTVVAVLRINLGLFFVVFLVVALAVIGLTFAMPAKYTSSSTIEVGISKVKVLSATQDATADTTATDATAVDTEVEVLKSLSLAEAVATKMNLDKDPDFNPTLVKTTSPLQPIEALFSAGASKSAVAFRDPHQAVIANLVKAINVKRQGLTRVVTVSVETSSPVKSAEIADAWVEQYAATQISNKSDALTDANGQLGQRLQELQQEAANADNAVQQYKVANHLVSDDNTLGQQQLGFLQQQLASVRTEVVETQGRLAVARRQLASPDTNASDSLSSDVLRDLRAHSADVSGRLAILKSRYGAMHPDVIKTENEKASVDAQIKSEIARLVANLETEASVATQKQQSLQAQIGSLQGTLNHDMTADVKLRDLQLTADTAHSVYQEYLQRYKVTTTQQGMESTNTKILSKAKVPTSKSSPKTALFAVLGVGLGFVAGSVAVAIKYAMRTGLSSGTEVTSKLGMTYLGGIADLKSTLKGNKRNQMKLWDYIEANPMSIFAEHYKILLTAINFSKVREEKRVIAITSAIPGEGKTTTSICLAKTINMGGQSVIVVDCDMRRRSVSVSMGGNFDKGLVEVLEGSVPLDDALYDGGHGVTYLPISTNPLPSENLFGSSGMANLLEELKRRYDVVVLDTAPVLPIVDTRILAHKADVVVVLAKWDDTPVGATQTAIDILLNEGVDNIAGVALTLIDLKKQSASAGIGSEYYYNSYKSYYTK